MLAAGPNLKEKAEKAIILHTAAVQAAAGRLGFMWPGFGASALNFLGTLRIRALQLHPLALEKESGAT